MGGLLITNFIDNQVAMEVDEMEFCNADNEEVNDCLPVQQCAENNSVNSANICIISGGLQLIAFTIF